MDWAIVTKILTPPVCQTLFSPRMGMHVQRQFCDQEWWTIESHCWHEDCCLRLLRHCCLLKKARSSMPLRPKAVESGVLRKQRRRPQAFVFVVQKRRPFIKGGNPLNTILQITVLSCFACTTQLADFFPNVGKSFLIGIPVPGSTSFGNVQSKHSPNCTPKCFPLPCVR